VRHTKVHAYHFHFGNICVDETGQYLAILDDL